ncbi:hypothetical protein AVEN_59914-1 [Araneus ventricosus]|uniref:Uncharacterized protein n=1 Tax=Araneus ventricosus TaxID=182803 RepID=A0A4Y2EHY5_ARAVE|nr:hypothetical protein AVEN_59914-1 [Araneus ventricosus]
MTTIYEAVKYAMTLQSDIKIWIHSESNLKPIANGSTTNKIAREIKILLHLTNIRLACIRAYVGHPGNEMADSLAKTVITTAGVSILQVPLPRCNVKSQFTEWAMKECQDQWDLNVVGRSTYDVLPKVSLKPEGWQRELTIFVSGHGTFSVYLKRIARHPEKNCACG